MKIPKNMIIISAILCSINFVDAEKIPTAPYVIENNRQTSALCRLSANNTTRCSFIIKSSESGYTYRDVCSFDLPVDFSKIYIKTLHTIGNYVIYSSQKITDDTAIIHVRFIDMNKCTIKSTVNHEVTLIEKNSRVYHKIILFEDDTFDILYFDSSNLNSSGKVTYDFNGTRIGDTLNLYKNFSEKLKKQELGYRNFIYYYSPGYFANWAPISAADGFFHLSFDHNSNKSIISTITRDLRIKNVKTLLTYNNIVRMSFGYEHLAIHIRDNDNQILKCYLFDKDLNIVFDVNINLVHDVNYAQLYVIAPKEVLVLVEDYDDDDYIVNFRIFKINENGKISKALVMPNMKVTLSPDNYILPTEYYAHLNIMNERYCFTFYSFDSKYEVPVNNEECIDKQALEKY